MAGIPGKGGRTGKSGRPSDTPGIRKVPISVSVAPATKAKLMAQGPKWMTARLEELAAALEG